MDGWIGREFQLQGLMDKVKKWQGGWMCVCYMHYSAWTCFCGQGMLSELDKGNWKSMEYLFMYTMLQVLDMLFFSAPGMLLFQSNRHALLWITKHAFALVQQIHFYFSATGMLCFVFPNMHLLQCRRHALVYQTCEVLVRQTATHGLLSKSSLVFVQL